MDLVEIRLGLIKSEVSADAVGNLCPCSDESSAMHIRVLSCRIMRPLIGYPEDTHVEMEFSKPFSKVQVDLKFKVPSLSQLQLGCTNSCGLIPDIAIPRVRRCSWVSAALDINNTG